MRRAWWLLLVVCGLFGYAGYAAAQEAILKVDATRPGRLISPYLAGACIEDVNHEIYGGLYSQMIFGESFQEPPRFPGPFDPVEEGWRAIGDEAYCDGGDGPKLVARGAAVSSGEVGVEVYFPTDRGGNAGLIVKVDRPERGADSFTGYEVSLETSNHLVLGRHRRNWEPIERVSCPVPVKTWIPLVVRMQGDRLEIVVNGEPRLTFEDRAHPLKGAGLGLRVWQRPARFRNLHAKAGDQSWNLPFTAQGSELGSGTSGMWTAFRLGSAQGRTAIVSNHPFVGRQSQRLEFTAGAGAVGIANAGLNRWGMNFQAGKPYEGHVWARADEPARISLACQGGDGQRNLGQTSFEVRGTEWTRHDFSITPQASDDRGRFSIMLESPGAIELGHAFLQPGPWGRFHNLPDRKDVAQALIDQGINVLRYGGSMINHPAYRWKNMIGPRDRRPPTAGTWYPYSSNGWGIFDFLRFCEAAGFLAVPAVNMDETPADMADFVQYANGAADTTWGRKRAQDGHPAPYRLRHLELGNEEAVNEAYYRKFERLAKAIWAQDPEIILVVGDFAYGRVITDPFHFEGGVAANTLAAHQKILELAKAHNREVWFDIHVGTDHPPQPNGLKPEHSYIDQLGKLAPQARFKVVIFEYNSGNHAVKRALSNALANLEVERIGDPLAIVCSANCLQPDGQNDNGWDQGLLFLNPSRVWLQPPGYVTRMIRRNHQPRVLPTTLQGKRETLDANAKQSEDGKTLVIQVVNWGSEARLVELGLNGYQPALPIAQVEALSGALEAVNTADAPDRVVPHETTWRHKLAGGKARYTFPARSFTILRFQ